MEEVNTKTGRPNKLKVLYQKTVRILEEKIPKKLQRQNKLVPYQANFVEEHLKEVRKCNANFDYHWLAYISKGTQPAMNAEQRREERMNKFDVEFETKMRLEQARFERRRLELEMHMKELET